MKLDAPAPREFQKLAFPLAKLKHDPQNLRQHEERNIQAIAASMRAFGWRTFLVAHKRTRIILAGNARAMAARELGWKNAPVLFVDDDERQGRRYAIADNRTAELASWDPERLIAQLNKLDEQGTAIAGWTDDEIERMAAAIEKQVGSEAEDEAEEEAEDEANVVQVRLRFTPALWKRWQKAMARLGNPDPSLTVLKALGVRP